MELVGKLAGSVFQDSYGGFQIRTRVSPANPQTNFQQLRRGEFAFLTGHWRSLTAPQVASWVAEAGTLPEAFRLYVSSNINASLIGQPLIDTFISSAIPVAMPLIIDTYTTSVLSVVASGSPTAVPADHSLLLSITYQKAPTKVFTNPSQFSPIAALPAGTDFSSPIDFAADWISRYGIFKTDQRLCIASALVNDANGLRGATSINCGVNPIVPGNFIIDFDGTFVIDSDGTFIEFP